nr:hypothetical protein [Planococcus glaciei]
MLQWDEPDETADAVSTWLDKNAILPALHKKRPGASIAPGR